MKNVLGAFYVVITHIFLVRLIDQIFLALKTNNRE